MRMQWLREQRARALASGQASRGFRAETGQGGVTELYFYDPIDSWGGYWGISAKDVIEALMGVGDVLIHMNSPGGEAIEALAIYSTLRQHPGQVTVRVEGMAASAASVVMLAGNRVEIDPNAMVMIHDAWGVEIGNAEALHAYADMLNKVSDNIASIYHAKNPGTPPEQWRTAMKAETWYVGAEALDAGLVDAVAEFAPADGQGEVIGDDAEELFPAAARLDPHLVSAMYPNMPGKARAALTRAACAGPVPTPAGVVPDAPAPVAAGATQLFPGGYEAFRAALKGLSTV